MRFLVYRNNTLLQMVFKNIILLKYNISIFDRTVITIK